MKKWLLMLLAAALLILSGCGMYLVEDDAPVYVGCEQRLTERC